MKKQISIVGGGAAGWLSALYVNKLYGSDADVTLIESEDIGILGAGEGSTAIFVIFLSELGIDLREFIYEVNATHKIGVSFENWNNDGKRYLHDFFSTDEKVNPTARLDFIGYTLKNNLPFNETLISKKMAYDFTSPVNLYGKEIIHHSFHFDANLLAKYLRKIAEQRGVKRIEGIVNGFEQNDYGDVIKINLENSNSIKTDFVFDCSGFARLVIGKLYNSKWISYKDKLTVNSAIPFMMPPTKDHIKPYTTATAMKYGWCWQIPLQNRIGCGYVFDNNFIDESQALNEIKEKFGIGIDSHRVINFEAGRFNEIWINNCLAVGLSAAFVEPLEATSIGMTISTLKALRRFDIDYKDAVARSQFNFVFNESMDDILDFLQYHYITKRNDTEFWKYYQNSENWTDRLSAHIKNIKENLDVKLKISIFAKTSYTTIGFGLEQIPAEQFIEKYEQERLKNPKLDLLFSELVRAKDRINREAKMVSELEYIEKLKASFKK